MSSELPLYGFGGGTSLNFKIVAYATEESLLAATPAENTIGVITTTAIASWIFSAEEPTSPTAGMVWITTSTSSAVSFNALKKNGVMVYPLYAKQYVSSAWVDVTAMSYQGGEWVEWWGGEIYQNGEFFGVAGKIIGTNRIYDAAYQHEATAPTITNENANLTIALPATNGCSGAAVTEYAVDVTDFKTLSVTLSASDDIGFENRLVRVGLYEGLDCAQENAAASCSLQTDASKTTYNVDVSGLTGNYYVAIYMQGYNAAVTVTLYELVLVR